MSGIELFLVQIIKNIFFSSKEYIKNNFESSNSFQYLYWEITAEKST